MDTLDAAIGLFRLGNLGAAEAMCTRLLAADTRHEATLSALAEMLTATGHHERSLSLLATLAGLRPQDAAVHRRLGAALLSSGRLEEAADVLQTALQLEPANVRAHNNLGQALLQLKRIPEAIASFDAAVGLDPNYAIGHVNRALALDSDGRAEEALAAYERALALSPQRFEAWVGCGTVLARLERLESALDCFTRALALKPRDALTLTHLAAGLLSLERAAESLTAVDAALRADGGLPRAHTIRAGALRRLGRRTEAAEELKIAIALDPQDAEAWGDLGTLLHELGRFEESLAACRRAVDLNPLDLQARSRLLARLIPSVPESAQQVEHGRESFEAELAGFDAWLETRTWSSLDALTLAQQQFFYLSYDERSNRQALQSYRGACAARLEKTVGPLEPLRPRSTRRREERLKLGFVSAHVYDHSVFNALLRGWLRTLDRRRFELTLFSLGTRVDDCTESARASVDHFVDGIRGTTQWLRAIRRREMDALIYPELGMHETTLGLASLRLARRQYAAWGHPETSGLSTLDGYLSAELMEPPDAAAHYTEPLIRLPNLGVYCEYRAVQSVPVDFARWGLAGDGPRFICAGVPFKYRPQHDDIYVDIARRLGRCTFLFFESDTVELSRRLQDRLIAAFARGNLSAAQYLRFIPWQPRAEFCALMRQADVYLDTLGFSGFNTLLHAVESGLPCVTHEGKFLRGRLGSGILTRMDLGQCIAHDRQEYIDQAVRLAADAGYRASIRAVMQRNRHRLYADQAAVDALAAHLTDACG